MTVDELKLETYRPSSGGRMKTVISSIRTNASRWMIVMSCIPILATHGLSAQTGRDQVRVLLVTGGTPIHYHKTLVPTSLYGVIDGDRRFAWDHASLDEAAFESDIREDYDVVVFFNRNDSLSSTAAGHLVEFVESGKGVVVLHSGLSSYNHWVWWWRDVVGGKYQVEAAVDFPPSGFSQDEHIRFRVASEHPITEKVGDFSMTEEVYNGLGVASGAQVLYRTDNPNSDGPLVWIGPHTGSRVVVVQPGHDAVAFRHEKFRALIRECIAWAGRH